jgi:hypothetical protein
MYQSDLSGCKKKGLYHIGMTYTNSLWVFSTNLSPEIDISETKRTKIKSQPFCH